MRRFFLHDIKNGMPISTKGFAKGIMRLAEAFEKMKLSFGYIEWTEGHIPKLIMDSRLSPAPLLDEKSITLTTATEDAPQKIQLREFENPLESTTNGLSDVLTVDTETGEVTSTSSDYELVVRVNGKVSYMPLGNGTGEDPAPDQTGECGDEEYPAGGAGDGDGYDSTYGTPEIDEAGNVISDGGGEVGDGSTETIYSGGTVSNDDNYAGKSSDCW